MSLSSKEIQRLGFAGSAELHKPQDISSSPLTTANLEAQVTSYQAADYDDAIQKCHDWHGLDKAAKKHFLFQALIEGSEEGISRKQVFLDLPDGFVSNGTFYNWINAAPEDQQKLFPPAQERPEGYKKKESKIGHSEKESKIGHSLTTASTPEMSVPILLDQTTAPDGLVVDNLEAAYEAPPAVSDPLGREEPEKPLPGPQGGLTEPLAELTGYLSKLTPSESIKEEETAFTKLVKELQAAGRALAVRVARGEQGNLTCNIRPLLQIASEEFTKLHLLVKEVEAAK